MLLAVLAALAVVPPATAAEAGPAPKAVVLGFDGADAEMARQWMDAGELPNLAKLRDEGTFAPLRTTIPSQTPVSWSTFSTGLNPGRHSIFDFLLRHTDSYRPDFAAFEETRVQFLWGERNGLVVGLMAAAAVLLLAFLLLKLFRVRTLAAAAVAVVLAALAGGGAGYGAATLLPTERPQAVNRQQGETFWETLGAAGKRVRVIRVPVTFPPDPFHHGELLSGLGVPDMSFRIGKPFYFTSELFFQPKAQGDFSIEVVELIDNQGVIDTEIQGPPNKLFPEQSEYIEIPMTLTVAEDRSKLTIEVSGQTVEMVPGAWSDWVEMTFPFNALIKLHGIGRFRLLSLEPDVRLYLSPIQFDPDRLPPILDVSTPRELAGELVDRFGRYKTQGWAIDTWSITEGTIDEAVFLEDVENTVSKSEEMLLAFLEEDSDDWDLLVHYFEFTDRVQHVMFRHIDPEHPLYDEAEAAKWGPSILDSYKRMDAIVGQVMERLPEGTALFVVSDHGFAPWRWAVNYNTWLAREGYLVLEGEGPERANLEDLFDQGEFFVNVDWSRTRAYAMGLGNIYVNLAGREGQGIVQPGDEYRQLVTEIKDKLEAYVHEETGENPVAHVFTRDEAYGTYDPQLIPDLFLSNNRGYRVGWQDSLGIVAKEFIEPNVDVWSGDHCSLYPPLVKGVFYSNHRMAGDDPYMADVPATLLDLFGVEPPVDLDGESLLPPG